MHKSFLKNDYNRLVILFTRIPIHDNSTMYNKVSNDGTLIRYTMLTVLVNWLVGWPNEICILCYFGLYLPCKNQLIPSVTTFYCFPLLRRSHNPPMSWTEYERRKKMLVKKTPLIQPFSGLVTPNKVAFKGKHNPLLWPYYFFTHLGFLQFF